MMHRYVLESTQIRSRGSASSLVGGTLIAVPSGFAVVLAITSGAQNAVVGVAIAAALLPPIVNAGLCWALAFCARHASIRRAKPPCSAPSLPPLFCCAAVAPRLVPPALRSHTRAAHPKRRS